MGKGKNPSGGFLVHLITHFGNEMTLPDTGRISRIPGGGPSERDGTYQSGEPSGSFDNTFWY